MSLLPLSHTRWDHDPSDWSAGLRYGAFALFIAPCRRPALRRKLEPTPALQTVVCVAAFSASGPEIWINKIKIKIRIEIRIRKLHEHFV